ncbi:uncharacterized protein LOC107798461 isoform X2 [Nicotiana tabacum]|uniref:Uncharacterized protein LOC107798461 isoform X2 n=1 Tax=Nicotiana tabacum TaxID=4097 RepID=A0A1S4AJT0_TOBAC|nr:PREDICTED: uncharacterized protein LOC107798461 isoform X2 [Nicotiana tabacum]
MKKNRKIVTRIWDLYAPRAKFWAYFPTSPKLKREVGVTFAFNESPFLQNVHCNLQPVKMKPRLAASISALMAGERAGICKAISGILSESQTFNGGRNCSSFQFQRFKSSKGLQFVCDDDDDFSELGSPVERAIGQLKLLTEKPDPFVKHDNGRKVSSSKSSRSESKQSRKGGILNLDKPHQTSCEFGNGDDASGSIYTTSDAARMNVRRSISVGNVPSTISLSQLVEAVSVFGKVCTASVRDLPDGLNCWDIQFESLESCNRATRAGALTVGKSRLQIHPLRASMVVTIRIKGISRDASFGEIHSICKVGTTEGLAWVSKDSVDALFTVETDTESQSILKKLNGTTVGGHRLSASLLSSNSSSASMSANEDARCKMGLQISSYLTVLKLQLEEKKVHLEDLQMLHEGIMHLEDLPSNID